ncbi:hypothetical protein PUP68_17645 [Pseudomonas chlororaphis]|uniref:hypothetical protein n=1 Tax=Pseudomonas chlororaphis TaxID=587753 RepID=UPI00087CE8EC|nr:hypothetical protein [Pseudomonas chlororaphis]AZC31299.1 Alkaline phosphatase [Pseudomonas chlororaphis subsp. piscium]WDG78074.1 hypothetical protein PUP77_27215 [Pseudomonas chlororaphis]WDG82689.1 hypothetical protein PUP68_17645 [Pseudomonas chlororaphis]WDG89093.1 hypothetical protein PUP49_17460 [Pseudomonas chlororaphis]SDS95739.1 hypothetical protein SAMN05216585_4044 [Pseudomonas chlororaphis]
MPIIYKATKNILRAVNYGIALGTNDKGWSDIAVDFFGNVTGDAVSTGINQINTKQELYWSPYADIPGIGNVYSVPSLVVNGTTMYSFFQGQSLYTSDDGVGGYPYYSARQYGTLSADQLCAMTNPPPSQPSTAISAVMFGGNVYAFYGGEPGSQGQTGLIYYNIFSSQTWSWSQPTQIPIINVPMVCQDGFMVGGTWGVYPVVFTPPGEQAPQLYLFYAKTGTNSEFYSSSLEIGCVTTSDGQTWTDLAPNGIGPNIGTGQLSPVVYSAPGSDTEQILLFYVDENSEQPSYIAYPDSAGGFGSPVTVPVVSANGSTICVLSSSAIVHTPPGAPDPLLYVFYQSYGPAGYQGFSTCYVSFDGTSWSSASTLSNGKTVDDRYGSTLATFPPESFNNSMASTSDIYFTSIINGLNNVYPTGNIPNEAALLGSLAAFVSSMSDSTGTSQATPLGAGSDGNVVGPGGAFLLAVDLPGFSAPQPWLFYSSFDSNWTGVTSAFQYAVYENGQWTPGATLPAVVEPGNEFPSVTGSPAVLPITESTGSIGIVAVNTAKGIFASSGGPTQWSFTNSSLPISGTTATGSPALAYFNGLVYLFYQDTASGKLYCTTSTPNVTDSDALGWCTPYAVNGVQLTGSPTATVYNNDLYVFYQGEGSSGALFYSCLSGSTGTWSTSTQIVPKGVTSSAIISGTPSACACTDSSGNNQLFVFYGGIDSGSGVPLMYCLLGSDGTSWTQAAVSGVFITDSPSSYWLQSSGKLNIFFQLASSPGVLAYIVHDISSSSWSPVGTTTVQTIDGWANAMMYYNSFSSVSYLYIYHNNSGTNAGQIGYCTCMPMSTSQGCLMEGAFCMDQTTSDGGVDNVYYPAMTGAPSATIANGNIYVFYNSTYLESSPELNYTSGALAYMQVPLPTADAQNVDLGTPAIAAVGYNAGDAYGQNSSFLSGDANFISMANSPASVTFNGTPYVFFNTGSGAINYLTNIATGSAQNIPGASSVSSACSPAIVTFNGVLYLFWVSSGSNDAGTLQCSYSLDGTTWGQIETSPSLTVTTKGVLACVANGQIYLMYQHDGTTYYDIFPEVTTQTAETVPMKLAPATQISRMNCSTGPSVVAFDNNLWCVTQGVDASNYSPFKGWSITADNQLFFSRTFDVKCWSWNTVIAEAAAASVSPSSSVLPIAATFPSSDSSGDELLYVFWPAATGGYIQYTTTDGTYASPSSTNSAYGLQWSSPSQISSDIYTNDNVAVVAMPPLDFPSDPNQLYVFWQGSNHSGFLYYASMSPSGSWSSVNEVVPAGSNADRFMSLSPSAVSFASGSGTAQPYVFYQAAGSSGAVGGDAVALQYCTYANGTWTQYPVPNISSTIISEWHGIQMADPQTINGIDPGTPPRAIVFNDTLYVFYVTKTGGYTGDSSGKGTPYTNFPVSFSTYDGTTWSGLNTIGSTATFQTQTNGVVPYFVAQFVYPVEFNGVLYVFFMSSPSWGSTPSVNPPGVIYYTSTSDGSNWSSPQPTTNVVYVPATTTTIQSSTGTEINDTLAAVNGALAFVGLPTTGDIRNMAIEAAGQAAANAPAQALASPITGEIMNFVLMG